jgi:hypothetical protein
MGMTSKVALPPIPPRPPELGAHERIVLAALKQAAAELERGRRLDTTGTTAIVSATGNRWTFNLQFKP